MGSERSLHSGALAVGGVDMIARFFWFVAPPAVLASWAWATVKPR
jgi:hypothetical protein